MSSQWCSSPSSAGSATGSHWLVTHAYSDLRACLSVAAATELGLKPLTLSVAHAPRLVTSLHALRLRHPAQVASTDAAPPGSAAEFEGLKQQARAIVKKLNTRSPSRMSLDAGAESFKCVRRGSGANHCGRTRARRAAASRCHRPNG